MNKLNNLLNNLEAQVDNYSKLNQTISEGNVGWHIVHSCLVINSVCAAVVKSDASKFIKKFSFKAFWFYYLSHFQEERPRPLLLLCLLRN